MTYAIAWIVKRAREAKVAIDSAYALFLLVMMASMFVGALIYFSNETTAGFVEAVGLNMAVMTVGILAVLKYWIPDQSGDAGIKGEQISDQISLEQSVTISNAYVIYFVIFLASMTATGLIYIIDSSSTGIGLALAVGMVIMTAGVIAILRYSSQHSKMNQAELETTQLTESTTRQVTTIALVLLNEFLMGWVFLAASDSTYIQSELTLSNILLAFSQIVSSYWFIFIMVLEMCLTIFMFRRDMPKSLTVVLVLQAAVMLFSPPAVHTQFWIDSSAYISSGLMTVFFIYLYEHLYRNKTIGVSISQYFLRLSVVYALMMAGLFLWRIYNNSFVFALSIVIEMGLYFDAVLANRKFAESELRSWMSAPVWVFCFLVATFIAEFFMGGLIDIVYYGNSFLSEIPLAAVVGPLTSKISALLYNFLTIFASVTGSAWYLTMMGAEMGALVLFKIKHTRELETKIRLGLVVLTYFAYTVFLPYFFLSDSTRPRIPFIGWNMGIGTSGALAPAFVGAIAGTYLVSGALSFLFGGRQVCSLFCSASLMYQGTFPDSLKVFNRTSKIGRKLLTSKMNNIYRTVSVLVILSLIIASAISYLNSIGVINVTIYGTDVASLLYIFYFDFLWYVIFLAMPFIGVYGCATTGMCHWGIFNQLVGRLGIFRLKVRDPNQCVTCLTKDCAKACPVGLTDLPSSFISKGEFKSHKCIGVGDCVSSCPYNNEYFYDARNWFGKILRLDKNPSGTPLPVLSRQDRATVKVDS
ncbi:MAG: 4Fe-4S dicluster domain-containing protein [Thaumarchaeota archaeon]|nr:4Fe-4S dicluster domain-containing protein [Nitrososphaerota archaeon]